MRATLCMMRRLLCLVPWMVMAAASYGGQSRSAQVIYTHYGPLQETVYRVANECYAPTFAVEAWGWKVDLDGSNAILKAEGQEVTVPIRTVSGRQTIPLRIAFERLGAEVVWENDTLYVRSPLKSVKVADGKVDLGSLLAVKPTIFSMDNPPRYIVDIRGATLTPDTKIELAPNMRVGQYQPGLVRLVIESPDAATFNKGPVDASTTLSFPLIAPVAPVVTPPVPQTPVEDPNSQPPEGEIDDPASNPDDENYIDPNAFTPSVTVESESENRLNIAIRDFGPLSAPATVRRPEPDVIEVVLPGAYLALPKDFSVGSENVVSSEVIVEENRSILSLRLARPMGAEVVTVEGEVLLQLIKPEVGDGRLAGKVIVVDAGHGGSDGGAKTGGVYEKNLTLAISKLTAAELTKQGATVLMTRRSDSAVALTARADLANRNDADLFVSIHINSNGKANSTSGGITFYHKGSQVGKLLAECIQREIAKVSGLPNMGVWSDGRIYQNGFSVLRNTRMPGVLIELGFINHSKDRKRMITQDFQTKISQAIVRGLKVYLGDAKE
jgi:N-acetylmuramoyl-L-alanine amidase